MSEQRTSGWLSNRPIQTKMLLAFGAILLTFLVAVAAILIALTVQRDARQWSQHTHEVIDELSSTVRWLHEVDIYVRDLNMSGERKSADEYRQNLTNARQHLDKALSLTGDSAAQQARLRHAEDLLAHWIQQTADPTVTATTQLIGSTEYAQKSYDVGMRYLTDSHAELGEIVRLLDEASATERGLLEERNQTLEDTSYAVRMLVLGMFLLGLIVGIVALVLSSRLITQPIRHLTGLMTRLADKDHAIEVAGQQRADEIGSIARALDVFKHASIATAEQSWVKSNVAEVAGVLQSAENQDEFARALTAEVAPRIKAGVAVFFGYDAETRQLDLRGSYGFKHRKHLGTRYALGEGLVGQVALERKSIVLQQVPDDYVRIHSGTGEAPPRNVIALPLMLQEQLLGVLEFGSFVPFGKVEQDLLEELLPFAALSLENLNRAVRTQQLLTRTQQQAQELQTSEEELRVQQEELAATNEELQAKTVELEEQQQRLRTSEEELRVQAEELQASNEELRQKTDTLNEQKQVLEGLQQETENKAQELARASQYKSDFLANMSHELRTPLNSLLILSRNLADNESGNLDGEQVESARVIHESGSNLLRLINDILDLSKIEAGKMHAAPEEFSLQHFVQTLLRRFKHVAGEKALEFDVNLAEGLPTSMYTDGTRLEQIANNLVGNAFKFTRQGSVRVDIARPKAELARRFALAPDGAIAITVSDTGIGIPSDKLDHIFGTFEQMDASTSRKYGGSGLGLAIARRLGELLGGGITVESVLNEGSRFTVVLPERLGIAANGSTTDLDEAPRVDPAPIETSPPAPTALLGSMPKPWVPDDREALRIGDTVILAIEDDPVFARTLVDMIRRKGYRALAAGDGESGLYLARQYRPTGILLDVMLPGIDGWDVITRLKQDPVTRRIPVHFISAADDTARAQQLGAVGFLTKPAERDALLGAFERLMQSSSGPMRKVLLVDDDPDSRVAVASLIKSDTVEIVEASSAEEALPLFDSNDFDVMVLDLGLPGMSGFEFLDLLGARKAELPPIVIHSGRELSREESAKLRQYTDSIVIKGTRSLERLLDEVSLFLHSVRKDSAPRVVRDIDSGLAGRTVLVVDDDMRNIFALSKILREKGLSVVMAQDGQKALRQVEENKAIEIVLMDIMMPGMDGYETMREIRKRPVYAKLPIIAVTAKAMAGDRDKCLEAGANDYLAKPIDIDKLLSMMRVWLHA
ncbi:response regulator [Dokdonella sp.]|uniref:response regulator n=1 Tax=Dokdonella sp. TaxID=2291710 RepID=UPI001B099E32|nr:response regulator [Dokdonella sp.]MBO9664794.1 response regulator [Dokdonella sp.]